MRDFRRSLIGIAIVLLLAVLVGVFSGWLTEALLLVVSTFLALHLFALWQFGDQVSATAASGRYSHLAAWRAIGDSIRHRQSRARRQRRRLLTTLQAYRDAATALPDAVVALDGDRRITWFNAAAQELLQLDRRRDIGSRLTDLLRSPRMLEWLVSDAAEPLTDVAAPCDDQIRLSMRQIHDQRGQRLVIARDISQLQRLEQVRRDFVANVSHELRTPLTVVHGYLDMIDPEDVPDYAPILRELRGQSRRMTEIVEDLLTLSRLDASDPASNPERVALAPMLETLRREAEALSKGRHRISVRRDSEFDLSGSVKDLHSAFSNLVSNAVRYTPAGGDIAIAWSVDADGGRLEVIDSGPGIPAHHIPRLTERFYRVSTSRSRETGGTGLGLSIVKHVLQLHDAHLQIASEMGNGSRFACVFDPARLLVPSAAGEDA
ncbi:MAG: phosphate regulon sensor histidine kinase PhoR [Dokdonella sp.]